MILVFFSFDCIVNQTWRNIEINFGDIAQKGQFILRFRAVLERWEWISVHRIGFRPIQTLNYIILEKLVLFSTGIQQHTCP